MVESRIEEGLELIWRKLQGGTVSISDLTKSLHPEGGTLIEEMVNQDYISVKDEGITLKSKGEKVVSHIIRCHRLAERLFHDVFEMGHKAYETDACTFEHVLSKEVTEAICTLLGHPAECPHGRPVPPGDCCKRALREVESVIVPLSELKSGEKGRVVYITTKHHPRLDKLTSMGLFPGVEVKLHQTFPSPVIQTGQMQIALDREILKDIHVRRI